MTSRTSRASDDINTSRKFVLEFIDVSTNCISNQSVIDTQDVAALCEIIDPLATDIHTAASYDLESEAIQKIKQRFGIVSNDASPIARLRSWHAMDELPYATHTNRELLLMLGGNKPFAAFSEYYPSTIDYEVIPESFFDPHVKSGLFVKRSYLFTEKNNHQTRTVLYSKKGEEWRIEAYILLKKTAEISGWNEGFERMEGTLLGYEDWQNDIYIEKMFNQPVDTGISK
jgi:hypothetical protein